ncbi:aldo/keto reductase [Cystobacter fuscus]
MALRFLVRHPSLFAIPKASREAHVRDNAAAATLTLSAEELRRIDERFPLGPEPASLPVI